VKKIRYQYGGHDDMNALAKLHALSWQVFYRGILSDDYLDNHAEEERLNVWQKRFEKKEASMIIITAKFDERLIGFACHFLYYHDKFGHYLDNLHVHPDYRQKGIGQRLLQKSMLHCAQFIDENYYLWVFEENAQAISFYEKHNGTRLLTETMSTPDGLSAPALLYSWVNT
jgi:GNAT superfamily N-acetyltransferase